MDPIDYGKHSPFNYREGQYLNIVVFSDSVSVGETTIKRREISLSTATTANNAIRLTFFTAQKSETISQLKIMTGGTAAAATPSIVRMGIYKVETNGDLTLTASTANDTTLFAAATTEYTKALEAPFNKVAGQRYAFGLYISTAVATPTFYGQGIASGLISATDPRLTATVSSLGDLPSTVASGSLVSLVSSIYATLLP